MSCVISIIWQWPGPKGAGSKRSDCIIIYISIVLYFSLTYIKYQVSFLISSFSCFLKFWDKGFSLFPTWFRLLFVVYQSSKIKSFHYFKYYVIILFFEESQWTNQYNRLNNTWKDFPEWYRQYKRKYHFKIIKIIRIRR